MKWTESEENLNRFFDHANNVHPTNIFTLLTFRKPNQTTINKNNERDPPLFTGKLLID
jgi:hypothetical protein